MPLTVLQEIPSAVQQTTDLIAAVDRCLLVGLARLGVDEHAGLARLGNVFGGTPLQGPLAEALAGFQKHEFAPKHGLALAAARAALQGAQHDALAAQAAAALGRTAVEDLPPAPATNGEAEALAVWRDGTYHWLMELAQTGFQHLELAIIAPFFATLRNLQDQPNLSRWAALLTGFHQELLHALPIGALPSLPIYRWADLWTRGFVVGLQPTMTAPAGRAVSGSLAPLGVDLRQHGSFIHFLILALLEEDGAAPRLVRLHFSSYKVDALQDEEIWCCFVKKEHPLLQALSNRQRLNVNGMTLLPSGDLLWTGEAKKGSGFPLWDWAAASLGVAAAKPPTWPTLPAIDRHPVQLAVPIFLDGIKTESDDNGSWLTTTDGVRLPWALERLGPSAEVLPEHLAKATKVLGLLRFDAGRWSVQPLAVEGGKTSAFVGQQAFEAATKKRKHDTLSTLRERASRLLRKKS